MQTIDQCPGCASKDLSINGTFEKPSIDYDDNSGRLAAIQLSEESDSIATISCNSCGSELKLTKEGLRVS